MTSDTILLPFPFGWTIFFYAIYYLSNRKEKTKIKITAAPIEKVHYRNPIIIKGKISSTNYMSIKWRKMKEGKDKIIDFSKKKYNESTCSVNGDEVLLHINRASAKDEASYQIEVEFIDGIMRSEKVKIRVSGEKPEILIDVVVVKVNYGETATLTGRIRSSSPLYTVQWKKSRFGSRNGSPLKVTNYFCQNSDILMEILNLESVNKESAGKYYIEAENIYGSTQSECIDLNIFGAKPKLTKKPREENIRFDNCLKIGIDIEATPLPHKIIWKKYDEEKKIFKILDLHEEKFTGSDTESQNSTCLCIPFATLEDSGQYKIEAENVYGHGSVEVPINVHGDKPEIRMNSSMEVTTVYGEGIELKAKYKSVPPLTHPVQWIKITESSQEILDLSVEKYKLSTSDESYLYLHINKVEFSDSGRYKVEVKNNFGAVESETVYLNIKGETPKFEKMPQSMTVAYGNSDEFSAKIRATPEILSATWMHRSPNGFTKPVSIEKEKYNESTSTGNMLKLVINQVEFQDEGFYFVRVENLLGGCKSKAAELKVDGDPSIYVSGPTIVMEQGSIHCKAYASVPNRTQFKWQKVCGDTITDIDITNDRLKNSYHQLPNPTLVIEKAKECDEADYRLAVQLGKEEYSNRISLHVLDCQSFITEKKNNCFRLYRLQTVCQEAIQKVFDKKVSNLQGHLKFYKSTLIKKKLLFQDQRDILYPGGTGTAVNSSNFDITLLTLLLNHTKLVKPTSTNKDCWSTMPAPTSLKKADDIVRIKLYRNELSHASQFEIATPDFNDRWLTLSQVIYRLGNAHNTNLMPKVWKIQNSIVTDSSEVSKLENEIKQLRESVKKEESHDTPGQCTVRNLFVRKEEIQCDRMVLRWEAPSDVEDLKFYDVLYQEENADCWKYLKEDNGSPVTLKGLQRNTPYNFKVRAVYTDYEGPYSAIIREETSPSIVPDILKHCDCKSYRKLAKHEIKSNAVPVNDFIQSIAVQENIKDLQDKSNRTILLIGTIGPEKKMFIEGLVNHLCGVVVTDKERFTILDENYANHETNSSLTYYILTQSCGRHINVIDCPVLTVENANIKMVQLQHFFEHRNTPNQIDIVCFFALSQISEYAPDFDAIFSIFGKDIAKNTLLISCLSENDTAPIKKMFSMKGINLQKSISLEFYATFSNYENETEFFALNCKWDANKKNYDSFLDYMVRMNPCHLLQTIQTLRLRNTQHELQEELLCKLREKDTAKTHLKEIQTEMNVYDSELRAGQNSLLTGTINSERIKENPRGNNVNNTNCFECFMTCHPSCIYDDKDKDKCSAMSGGRCTKCPKRCEWNKHFNKPFTMAQKRLVNVLVYLRNVMYSVTESSNFKVICVEIDC